jgi:peptidoglycan/xylan/chitin deacetylase (PgdA/CDA1 family)
MPKASATGIAFVPVERLLDGHYRLSGTDEAAQKAARQGLGDPHQPRQPAHCNRPYQERDGSIVLCHDGFQQTIDALPSIITRLRKKGYSFVTLDDGVAASP